MEITFVDDQVPISGSIHIACSVSLGVLFATLYLTSFSFCLRLEELSANGTLHCSMLFAYVELFGARETFQKLGMLNLIRSIST